MSRAGREERSDDARCARRLWRDQVLSTVKVRALAGTVNRWTLANLCLPFLRYCLPRPVRSARTPAPRRISAF